MFSTFILQEGTELRTPTRCDLHMSTVGFLCYGSASIQVDATDEPIRNGVLYVPSLLFHQSGARCKLRVTKCSVGTISNDTCNMENLEITQRKYYIHHHSNSRHQILYSHIKSALEKLVSDYGMAHTPSDLLICVGDVDTRCTLRIELEFLLKHMLMSSSSLDWYFIAFLPTNELSLSVVMETPDNTEIHSVTPVKADTMIEHVISDNTITARLTSRQQLAMTHKDCDGITIKLYPLDDIIAKCFTILIGNPIILNDHMIYDGIQSVDYMFTPATNTTIKPAEFVFMVDCSGSMSGARIQNASESLVFAIKSLPDLCYFNVVAFGSKYRSLFQSSQLITGKNIESGIQFANQLQACLGGTELLTPLKWILKKPPNDDQMRNIFLITDGAVPNVPSVLHLAQRHKENTRFHTFALGLDVCSELMGSIAASTDGYYKIIDESNDVRLQTKIMEVLQTCLYSNSVNVSSIQWYQPEGYHQTPPFHSSLPSCSGTVSNHSITLRKVPDFATSHCDPSLNSSHQATPAAVAINGCYHCENNNLETTNNFNCTFSSTPVINDTKKSIAISQYVAWCKMAALEDQLLKQSYQKPAAPKPLNDSDEDSPPAKRQRLNGTPQIDPQIDRNDIIKISSMSGVPFFPYTYLSPSSSSDDDNKLYSITPLNESSQVVSEKQPADALFVAVPIRKRSRHRGSGGPPQTSAAAGSVLSSVGGSLVSLAGKTASSINGAFKTAVNIVSLGLINLETTTQMEDCDHGIEDQEYYQNQTNRIHWNEDRQLVFPNFYYTKNEENSETKLAPFCEDTNDEVDDQHLPGFDCTISTDMKLKDCSLQAYYIPLIQLQLPCGAWPLSPALSAITKVSIKKILELPVSNGHSSHYSQDGQSNPGHVWATALAIAFLKTNYDWLKAEWNLVVLKGHQWISLNKECVPLPITDINKTALQLINS